MTNKVRLSATVDESVHDAAREAVQDGRAPNVSAWINDAMRDKADRERALVGWERFISWYESEHGEITDQEMRAAAQALKERGVRVRGRDR